MKEANIELKLKLGTNNFANKDLWNPYDFDFNDKYGNYRDRRRSLQGSAEAANKDHNLLLLDSNKTLHGDYHQLRNLNFARSDYTHYYYSSEYYFPLPATVCLETANCTPCLDLLRLSEIKRSIDNDPATNQSKSIYISEVHACRRRHVMTHSPLVIIHLFVHQYIK